MYEVPRERRAAETRRADIISLPSGAGDRLQNWPGGRLAFPGAGTRGGAASGCSHGPVGRPDVSNHHGWSVVRRASPGSHADGPQGRGYNRNVECALAGAAKNIVAKNQAANLP